MTTAQQRELASGWQFRAADAALGWHDNFAGDTGWTAATVPGTVYQDLIATGQIADPHVGLNEQAAQWVAERDWCYRLDFQFTPDEQFTHTDLLFEGLDTFACVRLNGIEILRSSNMFVPARVDVARLLREGSNRLEIRFDSALRRGRAEEALFGRRHLWNGDASRLYVRKAQYHYGWDWGPVMLTAGPWRPIRLHSYTVRIASIDSPIWLAADLGNARVDLTTQLDGTLAGFAAPLCIEHTLYDPNGQAIACQRGPAAATSQHSIAIAAAQLWWPAGLGDQPLYRLSTRVLSGTTVLAQEERRLGVRQIRLVQEPVAGEAGRSFYFEVNGRALFTGGANWIPDDTLLNRITTERYRARVAQARAGNMRMLRVWGGGIYEDDAFYDACDELGVLVWQDFLFACGMYPAHPDFLASVTAEAEAAVRRLRHRPSLAIWCGNNEDYALAESIGQYGPHCAQPRFDGRTLYEQVLPQVCARLDPARPYWPGSPYSPHAQAIVASDDATVGDRHSWEVWHKEMLPYQHYSKVQARFVSEFGMQSHASLALLEHAIPAPERFALSRTLSAHNKAGSPGQPDGHRRLAVYIADTLNCGPTLADAVYASQFVQGEAMRYAFQDFRRRWQRPGARAVGGALVWQLNDCWPGASWAVIDGAGTLKPAWHSIRRALAECALAVRLEEGGLRGWLMNDNADDITLSLIIDLFSLSGSLLYHDCIAQHTAGNSCSEFHCTLPEFDQACVARVRGLEGDLERCRDLAWPEPFRFYRFAGAPISVQRELATSRLGLRASVPVKGVWLEAEGLAFADNFIDLLPDETYFVTVSGDLSMPIRLTALDRPATLI